MSNLPVVSRVETSHGSHIEPSHDEYVLAMSVAAPDVPSDLVSLRWQAAVVCLDGGVDRQRVDVHPSSQRTLRRHRRWPRFWRKVEEWESTYPEGAYAISISGPGYSSSGGCYPYATMWVFLTGFGDGARTRSESVLS